jgi:F0F1-type ATP synthase delta subunit
MEEIIENIIKNLKSKNDIVMLLDQINLAEGLIFKGEGKLSEKGKGMLNERFRYLIIKLEEKGIIYKNNKIKEDFFDNLKNYLKKIKIIKIKIAFKPSEVFLIKLSNWIKKNIDEKSVLDIEYDAKIIGGAVIEYQGKRIDFSIESKINEIILNRY